MNGVATTMIPSEELLPDVLPTERLMAGGKAVPEIRAELRRIPNARDLFGQSGWKNLKSLFRGLKYDGTRVHAVRILVVQAVLFGVFAALGQWWLYWVMWFLPWMTLWRVTNRLRAIAEHGGMERSKDRRRTTHSVRQHLAARFLMVPYNIGWHLAHHVDMGVPWKHLPAYHRELVASGWVPEGLEYRNYPALWRKLGSGADVAAMAEIEAELGSEFEPATAARRAPATAADTQLAGSAGPSS